MKFPGLFSFLLGATSACVNAEETKAAAAVRSLQNPTIAKVGNNGEPPELFPLGNCQGDCDNNGECGGTFGVDKLYCFQRSSNGPTPPGCDGTSTSGTDYCFLPPANYLFSVGNNGVPEEVFPLAECRGDCDRDSECATGLRCFHRSSSGPVPGCDHVGGNDYCYVPPTIPSGYLAYRQGYCKRGGSPYDHFYQDGLFTEVLDAPSACATYCSAFVGTHGYVGMSTKHDTGRCTCNFSSGALPNPAPTGSTSVLGVGVGVVNRSSGDAGQECYPISDYTVTPGPSVSPTPRPTRSPLPPTLQATRPLEDVGNGGKPAHYFPLNACWGDCDNDGECQDGLFCFQRNAFEAIPGCEGTGTSGRDYCFERPADYLFHYGNNGNWGLHNITTLPECASDCDNDNECDEGLICFKRSAGDSVPGCYGNEDKGGDFCIDPSNTEAPTPNPTANPTTTPTDSPSKSPSTSPSNSPTTAAPSMAPTLNTVSNIFDKESYLAPFGCADTRMTPRAVDGSTEKFDCDRTGLQNETAGLIVMPSHNLNSVAQALRIYSHNDCESCDPISYVLEARLDANSSWVELAQGNLPWSSAAVGRNSRGLGISSSYENGDTNLFYTEVDLSSNMLAALHYKISFPLTRDAASSSLQFSEIELAGVLYEHSATKIESPDPFVQAVSCPPSGTRKTFAPGFKIASLSTPDTFCGVFIQKEGGALIPYVRSYNSNEFEASPGPMAILSEGISCSATDCDFTLPDLEDSGDQYVILSKAGSVPGVREQIARFLELTTFGPKMTEIDGLDNNGSWGEGARADYVRAQIDQPATSHREYYRKSANIKWQATRRQARSDHPCSPNSKWRKYTFVREDSKHDIDSSDVEITFEPVAEEAGLTTSIYEADSPSDVIGNGAGAFRGDRIGWSGTGFYDFSSTGDYLEWEVTVAEAGEYPVSFRYSVSSSKYNGNRPCQLWVNNSTVQAVHDFPNTGGSTYWMYSQLTNVNLAAGTNSIKLIQIQGSGPDIDHLRVGKPQAIVIKTNGLVRNVARNGLHLLNQWPFEFTSETVMTFDMPPQPPQGDLYRYPHGRTRVILSDGTETKFDIGNPPIDFTGFENYLPANYFTFDGTEEWDETSTDLLSYVGLQGQELLLRNGITTNSMFCDAVPSFAEEGDAPIFGKFGDEWLQWTPTVQLEDNGPGINAAPEDMANNVLSDGGGEWSNKTGEKLKCSNAIRSFVNEATCHLSTDPSACSYDGEPVVEGGTIVCGSLGEVANSNSLPEKFAIETEEEDTTDDDTLENQRSVVWTEIALTQPDQLRQRMAWALAQIVTTVPVNTDNGEDYTEMWVSFYDIFVRHAFGNYRDILREASYNPLMAEHLTYLRSKSHPFVYEEQDKRISRADENYAREIMQLFSIGLIVLNDDGTPVLDPETGDPLEAFQNDDGTVVIDPHMHMGHTHCPPLETYSNDDIESFARSWTGFDRAPQRGNYEDERGGSASNRLDPMVIVPEWRDPFPKPHLDKGFIGDSYLLCSELPDQAFLKKGAGYRLLGGKSSPELMKDPDFFADDSNGILRVELDQSSELFQTLHNGGNLKMFVELQTDHTCTVNTVECKVDTLRVVKVGSVYFEYVERPCVQMSFYDNGIQIMRRVNGYDGTQCANPELTHAREACCRKERYSEVRAAQMESNVTYYYEGERMKWDTARDRCLAYGLDLCTYENVQVVPDNDSDRKGYHWTNKPCGINVKVNPDGQVAIVHDAMSTFTDNIPFHVEEENTLNWFRVYWNGDEGSYPGDSENNSCAANGCKTTSDGSCVCKTTMEESAVFTNSSVTKDDVLSNLFMGVFGPPDSSIATDLGNGVTAHMVDGSVDGNTVFEVEDKGKFLFLKNLLSTVSLEGWSMTPQIYEAEDATMHEAIVRNNTSSASGGEYVQARYGDETTFVEWNVDVPSSGTYSIALRYANDYHPRPLLVFVNTVEVMSPPVNPNNVTQLVEYGSEPTSLPLARCAGDCDSDSECQDGLFCMQSRGYEAVPGCSGTRTKGRDFCVSYEDFGYGFTLLPTGGWDDDWHYSEPLSVELNAGQNTIKVQIPLEYGGSVNIDHLKVEGATSSTLSSFRNPPHFVSLITDTWPRGTGEQNLRDAQYETEAVLDHYFYHNNVAPFLCTRIMQRFSFSNPSRRYVKSCVKAFRTGSYTSGSETFGSGEYGSLEAMTASILLDREANDVSAASDPSAGAMREPILKVTNVMRSMDYQTAIPTTLDGAPMQTTYNTKIWKLSEKIGQGPFDFPSVFSFLLPGYVADSGPTLEAQLTSPETMLTTMPNTINLLNGLFSLVKYGLSDCNGGLGKYPGYGGCNEDGLFERSIGHLMEPAGGTDLEKVTNLSLLLTAGRLGSGSLTKIVDACATRPDENSRARCMSQLLVVTPEFHSTNSITESGEDRVPEEEVIGTDPTVDYKAIVYFYLSGGLDSFHMLTPHTCAPIDVYARYRTIRGKSSIDEGVGLPLSRLLEIPANNPSQPCSSFGIHESFTVLEELYNQTELIFIANAGLHDTPLNVSNYRDTPARIFSHSDMGRETKRSDLYDEFAGSGVGGRMANVLSQAGIPTNTFSVDGQSVVLTGAAGESPSQFILSSDGLGTFNEDASIGNMEEIIRSLNNATKSDSGFYAETWSAKLTEVFDKKSLLESALEATTPVTEFPDGSLAEEFETVTRIMQTAVARGSKRDIFYVSYGGFDTHSMVDERLTEKFSTMDTALRGFIAELKALELWESTVVVQFSEFARTLDPNTGQGSDHAWGGNHFMFGGAVKGGKVLGEYPVDFEQGDDAGIVLSRGRMIPTSPWDSMWYGVAEWFGIPSHGPEMDKVLPMHMNFPASKLYGKETLFDVLGTHMHGESTH